MVDTISYSYPYLSIAKKYGVPYSTVLALADLGTHGRSAGYHECSAAVRDRIDEDMLGDINAAIRHFKGVQSGSIAFPTT